MAVVYPLAFPLESIAIDEGYKVQEINQYIAPSPTTTAHSPSQAGRASSFITVPIA